jgi:hypothetical protein
VLFGSDVAVDHLEKLVRSNMKLPSSSFGAIMFNSLDPLRAVKIRERLSNFHDFLSI